MLNERLSEEFLDEFVTIEEGWRVNNDLEADWCLDKIREARAEYLRIEMVAKAKIEQIQTMLRKQEEKMSSETSFFEAKLREYFGGVKTKDTKTQRSYQLPSGKLVEKRQNPEFVRNEDELLKWTKNNAKDFIKIKESVDWAELKKNVEIAGNMVVDKNTGEIVEGVAVVERDPKFEIVIA